MKRDYDVTVVGAGPAGTTAAYELAAKGVQVLLLDKAAFPRHKCCGGGLTVKAASLLGDGITEVVEHSISGASLGFAGANRYVGEYGRAVMYTMNRERFDHYLVQRAEKAGARVLQGLAAQAVNLNNGRVEVITGSGSFRSTFVVGADGSRSIVARSLNTPAHDCVVGIETEVQVDSRDLTRWKSQAVVDLGWISNGYAWLFPKSDHLSIGIACLHSHARDLKRAYLQFASSLHLSRHVTDRWSAGIIPMCVGTPLVAQGRAVLAGDAAGLADPLTGEGIYNAVLSGQLAAHAVEDALLRGKADLQVYQRSVEERIVPEIRAARMFSRVLGLMPRRLLNLIKLDGRIWHAGCALVRGETTYTAIMDRISSLGGLYSILTRSKL